MTQWRTGLSMVFCALHGPCPSLELSKSTLHACCDETSIVMHLWRDGRRCCVWEPVRWMAEPMAFAQGAERTAYDWTDKAFDLMTVGKLTVAFGGMDNNLVFATGECPRCTHDVAYTHVETIVVPQGPVGTLGTKSLPGPGSREGRDDQTDELGDGPCYVTVPVLCQCAEDHPRGPKDARGCGIAFNTELL